MSNIVEKIYEQNAKIEREIERIGIYDDREICSNVIEKLRTLIEHIAMLHYMKSKSIPEEIVYDNIEASVSFIKKDKSVVFLAKQHLYLQVCASHYVIDEMTSPRLMQKYCPLLYKIKIWIKKKYDVCILKNFEKLSFINTTKLIDYYSPISKLVSKYDYLHNPQPKERYYVHSCYSLFVSGKMIYEVTLGLASDYASKFNRFIVFSNEVIPTNYSIRCELIEKEIAIANLNTKIKIIQDWAVSIRPCEFENFGTIFGLKEKVLSSSNEYNKLMFYLNNNKKTILDIIVSTDYNKIKAELIENTEEPHIFKILDRAREFVTSRYDEKNLIKYLSYNLNNKIIKEQRDLHRENNIGLYINTKVCPFCSLPFAMSLNNHNPSIIDLIDIFGEPNSDELVYRRIRNATENMNIVYHLLNELFHDDENIIKARINSINSKLSWAPNSQIKNVGDFYYIYEYEDSTIKILNKLFNLSDENIMGYSEFAISQIENNHITIESPEKKDVLLSLFSNSKVACVYGPAGTGKSFLAKLISLIYSESRKIYISTTNTAVNNMYHKVGGNINDYMTINKYLASDLLCDILFIDECSMVSNSDMLKILNKNNFKCLVLLGDVIQIESIKFGNWYKIAKDFLKKNSKNELKTMFRTSSKELKLLWEKVRNREDVISEVLCQYGMIKELDDSSLFDRNENQIVLSLNYNGLYGINNLNSIMQEKNTNESIKLGMYTYKIDDPIIFTENNQYSKVLYNNLKGKILHLDETTDNVVFTILVYSALNEMDISDYPEIELIEIKNNKSIIKISIAKVFDSDNDEIKSNLPPFQIAYAVSIHKSQGLEFENVKIVISDDVDDEINHNIFYTAITRTSKNLFIYWSEETQKKILKKILENPETRDIGIISSKFNFKIRH